MDKELPFVKVLPPVVCPCPALLEEMVVVRRSDVYVALGKLHEGYNDEPWMVRLLAQMEKKL